MRMRTINAAAAMVALGLVGLVAGPASAGSEVPRMITGHEVSEFHTKLGPSTVCTDPAFPFEVVISAVGISSHLGRFTASGYECQSGYGTAQPGHVVWTAANGDELRWMFVSAIDFSRPNSDGSFPVAMAAKVEGGTGRFASATGGDLTHPDLTGKVWFSPDLLSGRLEASFSTEVTYDASDRAG